MAGARIFHPLGRPRGLPRSDAPVPRYTLNCEEPRCFTVAEPVETAPGRCGAATARQFGDITVQVIAAQRMPRGRTGAEAPARWAPERRGVTPNSPGRAPALQPVTVSGAEAHLLGKVCRLSHLSPAYGRRRRPRSTSPLGDSGVDRAPAVYS